MAHVAEWKKQEVKELKDMISSHEVIGIVNLLNIPAKQLQEMRKSLGNHAVIRLSKINLMNLAFEDCNNEKVNINGLSEYMEGQPAIVATDMNPFKLYKILEDNKTSAPAKVGSIASEDIIVPAGDTGFEPGPFLGELQQVGVQAKIDKGKIVVSKDCVLVPEGEAVSKQAASTLSRLGINPMEVGIDLQAVYEEESVYPSDVLAIDEEKTLADVQNAYKQAFNLSVFAAIPTKETISAIIGSAFTKSTNVAVEAGILTSETTDILLGLAQAKMLALASEVSDVDGALSDELVDKLANRPVAVVETVVEETPDDETEDEEESEEEAEEEAAAGLGALFG
ncbi:MAG: 50S ribosomal protein L10 [Methanobacteriaceae archaeon]|jgi:large subunit ribosomal protein L10|uniref:50S ribosomal protein L10 n=1 Tax=Methanobrevibacter TaxID=2172 RepID=UPI002A0E6ECC|nr:50S ribosomal protein L10 [Methanobacteriaceae archaeon]MDD3408010.1 50S ribosomal protein L10 [Methanobacteriaceae archaeon]MDD4593561.1 50S ribosomal protein L10 [Methanobacteriaceae archaeon]